MKPEQFFFSFECRDDTTTLFSCSKASQMAVQRLTRGKKNYQNEERKHRFLAYIAMYRVPWQQHYFPGHQQLRTLSSLGSVYAVSHYQMIMAKKKGVVLLFVSFVSFADLRNILQQGDRYGFTAGPKGNNLFKWVSLYAEENNVCSFSWLCF